MSGIDLHVVRQRQQLLVQAGMELRGILPGSTWKVGTSDGANGQRVSFPQPNKYAAQPRSW